MLFIRTFRKVKFVELRSLPSLIRFFRPRVPIFSQKLSSLSSFLTVMGVGRGDFGLGDAMTTATPKNTKRERERSVSSPFKNKHR